MHSYMLPRLACQLSHQVFPIPSFPSFLPFIKINLLTETDGVDMRKLIQNRQIAAQKQKQMQITTRISANSNAIPAFAILKRQMPNPHGKFFELDFEWKQKLHEIQCMHNFLIF